MSRDAINWIDLKANSQLGAILIAQARKRSVQLDFTSVKDMAASLEVDLVKGGELLYNVIVEISDPRNATQDDVLGVMAIYASLSQRLVIIAVGHVLRSLLDNLLVQEPGLYDIAWSILRQTENYKCLPKSTFAET